MTDTDPDKNRHNRHAWLQVERNGAVEAVAHVTGPNGTNSRDEWAANVALLANAAAMNETLTAIVKHFALRTGQDANGELLINTARLLVESINPAWADTP